MNASQQSRGTSEITMLAQKAIDQQSRVCQERMGRLSDRLNQVARDVDEARQGLGDLAEVVSKGTEKQAEQMTALLVAVEHANTENKTRWSFFRVFSGVIAALGALSGMAGLLISLLNRP